MSYHKKIILSIIIIVLLFAAIPYSFAQEAPETLEEAREIGQQFLVGFPQALKKPWQEALETWKRVWGWFKNLWNSYIWQNIKYILGREVEKRKPEIQEEFEKEKQEMKQEIPSVTKSLWQRFKDLIK